MKAQGGVDTNSAFLVAYEVEKENGEFVIESFSGRC